MHQPASPLPHGTTPPRFALRLLPGALALALGLLTPRLAAQPRGGPPPGFALNEVTTAYSYSSKSDVERNGKLGSVAIGQYDFATSFTLPAPETWRLSSELYWSRNDLDLTGPVPLPEKLERFGLGFMALKDLSREIGPGWTAVARLSPSFSSDDGTISGDSFSLFGLAALGKKVSPTLSWQAGLVGRTRGDLKVLPMIGLRWGFAPDWELSVGFPRTGVSYKVTEALRLNAGVMVQGGTYYLSHAPAAGLGHTYLDYREFRAGVGAEYAFSKNLSAVLAGGTTIDRRFDYYDRSFKLDGKSAAYGQLSVQYKF